jgi:signal peptidase II
MSDVAPSSPPSKRPYLVVAAAVLALDQWTKWLVESRVPLHTSREILPGVHLSHVRNRGVAFGLFDSGGEVLVTALLVVFGFAALALVVHYFRKTPPSHRRLLWALSLVMGGAVGNLVDRVVSGAVTDFVGVYLGSYRWPDFNVADSAISIGLCLLILDSFRPPARSPAAEEA